MNTVSPGRLQYRRRLHTALGTVAVTVTAVTAIAIGARVIGVTPPADDISMSCRVTGEGVQQIPEGPNLDPLLTPRRPVTVRSVPDVAQCGSVADNADSSYPRVVFSSPKA
jgi:hypothetical protein